MDYLKAFISKLQNLDRSRRTETIFKDFLTLCTCSLAQPFYQSDEIEQRYLNTIKEYTKEQAEEFPKLLALLVNALEEKYKDFLGQVYMHLNIGNKASGQFFTPYNVSKLMAEITFIDCQNNAKNQEIITLSEPCCGSGGIIIAYAEIMKKYGGNFQQFLFADAIDIDELCFQMTYIQLSLCGISARVVLGDTLAYKFSQIIYTPMYFINGFEWRLKEVKQAKTKSEKEVIQEIVKMKQLSLF